MKSLEPRMTFDEAMAKSNDLQLTAWQAIALKRPANEQRAALLAHIQFNPYLYGLELA